MKRILKATLVLAISTLFLICAVSPIFAEGISGVTTSTMYITWDEFPGAEEYVVEVFLGSESIPEAGADLKRIQNIDILSTHYSVQAVLGYLKSDFGYLEHPYGTYTVYITAKDADGNVISDRTRADTYEFGLDMMLCDYRTVTVSPGDGTGEGYTLFVPRTGYAGLPEFQMLLRNCFFTPPEGKVFDRWSAGEAGETITVESDMTITPVWKDIEEAPSDNTADDAAAQTTDETPVTEVPAAEETAPNIVKDTSSKSPTTGYCTEHNYYLPVILIVASLSAVISTIICYSKIKHNKNK